MPIPYRAVGQQADGGLQLGVGRRRQPLRQVEGARQQEQRRRHLLRQVQVEPLLQLEAESRARHAERAHPARATRLLQLPHLQRRHALLLDQLSTTRHPSGSTDDILIQPETKNGGPVVNGAVNLAQQIQESHKDPSLVHFYSSYI